MTEPLEIAPTTPDDALGVYAVVAAAYRRKEEADLIVDLFREDAVVLSMVARLEGEVIGACVFSRLTLKADASGRAAPAVALAPLAVAPQCQGCGVGSVLVRECLGTLKGGGERLVLVLGDPDYYGRFGFSAAAASKVDGPWSGPHLQALVLNGKPPAACTAVWPAAFAKFE